MRIQGSGWESVTVGVTHYRILPNNNIGALGTADHLTLLHLLVYGHGQPLNNYTTSNNKMFSMCASAIQSMKGRPKNLTWGLGTPKPLYHLGQKNVFNMT